MPRNTRSSNRNKKPRQGDDADATNASGVHDNDDDKLKDDVEEEEEDMEGATKGNAALKGRGGRPPLKKKAKTTTAATGTTSKKKQTTSNTTATTTPTKNTTTKGAIVTPAKDDTRTDSADDCGGNGDLNTAIDPVAMKLLGKEVKDSSSLNAIQVVDGHDVRLVFVEPKINSDKYYLIQLLQISNKDDNDDKDQSGIPDALATKGKKGKASKATKKPPRKSKNPKSSPEQQNCYYVYARWGRTGTKGQGKLDGPFDLLDEASTTFGKRFQDKTGYDWSKPTQRTKAITEPIQGKYTCLKFDANLHKQTQKEGALWQYYLQNDPLGKVDGWYDYDKQNSIEVEDIHSMYIKQGNLSWSIRFVTSESSGYTYRVNLFTGTQTNISSASVRPIRRVLPGQTPSSNAPPPVTPSTIMTTPISSPVASKASSASNKSTICGTVDPAAPLNLRVNGSIHEQYDAMLNQTDLKRNANKFIKAQLVAASGMVTLHKRWGRVGEVGQQQQVGPMNAEMAEKEFKKYFRSKTGNDWDERDNFVEKSGKYSLIDMESDSQVAEAQLSKPVSATPTTTTKPRPCTLSKPIQEFIQLIFNEDMFKSAMSDMEIDSERLPLGALSKVQIKKGREVLERIQAVLDDEEEVMKQSKLVDLSGEFYTVIPHAFRRHQRPPSIQTKDVLDKKFEMLNTLDDIEAAQDVMKSAASEAQDPSMATRPKHPTDANYDALMVDLDVLTEANAKVEWDLINKYLGSTSCSYSKRMHLEQILRVNRHREDATFQAHDSLKNRRLLWHGTNVAVVAAILKSGLRIMPHSGGRVGRGIYLADMHEKSAGYTRAGSGKVIMFLVEAALGEEHTITTDDPSLKCAPNGCHSVVARGSTQPDPTYDKELKLDDHDVIVPQGQPIPTKYGNKNERRTNFLHNEFLIYKESQHRIRYVLLFNLK